MRAFQDTDKAPATPSGTTDCHDHVNFQFGIIFGDMTVELACSGDIAVETAVILTGNAILPMFVTESNHFKRGSPKTSSAHHYYTYASLMELNQGSVS